MAARTPGAVPKKSTTTTRTQAPTSTPPAGGPVAVPAVVAAAEPAVTGAPLPAPSPISPLVQPALAGEGTWRPAGRRVDGVAAVYETSIRAPGSAQLDGIAWMDPHLLAARLYSGSASPGGGPWRYSAPIQPADASTLVAAFNGGFKMPVAGGGYYTQGRVVVPLRAGAASLVISADGSVDVGAWGSDVTMGPGVVSVRQNLVPLVAGGQPTPAAQSSDWLAWGSTIGNGPGVWRSGVGVTADGALVYAAGTNLDPLQLAQLLVAAGAIRGMELDINPDWTVLATYQPASPTGLAAPANGAALVAGMVQGPWTFFEAWWARDFVTLSARSGPLP